MARTFSYLMETEIKMDDFAIFESVSKTIYEALLESNKINNQKTNINNQKTNLASTAFEIALKKLN